MRALLAPVVASMLIGLGLGPARAAAATSFRDIGFASGPLTSVVAGNELSCQVKRAGDSGYSFYPSTSVPADCGTFVFADGTLFTPDFGNHPSSATANLGARVPFTPVSQPAPTGAGTLADPRRVTTTVDLGTTGIRVEQTDSYVAGQGHYRTSVQFSNTSGVAKNVVLYRAGDCYIQTGDAGFGLATADGIVGCSSTGGGPPSGRVVAWAPQSAGSHFTEDNFSNVWSKIGAHTPFTDDCAQCANKIDNGAGVSWNVSVPPGVRTAFRNVAIGVTANGTLPPTKAASITSVKCTYSAASFSDACTATVRDPSAGARSIPTGVVGFASNAGGKFGNGNTCVLSPAAGTQASARCAVGFTPPARGRPTLAAIYYGDGGHIGSIGSTNNLVAVLPRGIVQTLKATPSAFLAAPSGPSISPDPKYGTKVAATLRAPAVLTFTVRRARPGRKVKQGGVTTCRAPTKTNSGAPKCTRYVKVAGSFQFVGASGKNAFRFRGRVGQKTLTPGKYRLVAVPSVGAAKGPGVGTPFRVEKL